MKNWLNNEFVIITGASSGIGKELCRIFTKKYNAKVIGVARNEQRLIALKEELGGNFSYCAFDVTEKANWESLRLYLQQEDIAPVLIVNNAGAFPPFRNGLDMTAEICEQTMKINYYPSVYCVETLASHMKKAGKYLPYIVNVSSSAGLCPVVGTTAYTASKFALKGYTQALALDTKGKLHVGVVFPGTTATELFSSDIQTHNSALDKIAMPVEKMAKKIARKIRKRKRYMVMGWDAKIMNFMAKIMPVKGPGLIRGVMKASKSKVFKNVFKDE